MREHSMFSKLNFWQVITIKNDAKHELKELENKNFCVILGLKSPKIKNLGKNKCQKYFWAKFLANFWRFRIYEVKKLQRM